MRSVSIVDYKVNQADFFLEKLALCGHDFFAARCYSDSFASACRSITFAIQAVCKEIPGFEPWYAEEQSKMKTDSLCRFFNNYRTMNIHVGQTTVSAFEFSKGEFRMFFTASPDLPNVPDMDVVSCCNSHFRNVLHLVFGLYTKFPFDLDERWHFTKPHFDSRGLSVEDAEEALGYPRGWTQINGSEAELEERWRLLRYAETSGPEIQEIFQKHLNQVVEGPDVQKP